MRNIKIFIVTYKRGDVLNNTLQKLFKETDFSLIPNTEVNIINNHSDFWIDDEFRDQVNVIHNSTRPDWDVGNLARNWNEALLHGFKDLKNPDSKVVVTMQNDIVLHPNWATNLLKMHKKYNFITGCAGDNIISYTAEAVKKIGLWDERFCSISHKEADYYIRALIYNKEYSIINDQFHKRYLNADAWLPLDTGDYLGNEKEWMKIKATNLSTEAMNHSTQIFYWKWKNTWKTQPSYNGWFVNWSSDFITDPPSPPTVPNFIKYYYFEKDLDNLQKKNYIGWRSGDLWLRSTGNLDIDELPPPRESTTGEISK
tara:strand:+ start:42969 stop:43907 length:939 start_codon:yes stop_codon:yes gene_type:complete